MNAQYGGAMLQSKGMQHGAAIQCFAGSNAKRFEDGRFTRHAEENGCLQYFENAKPPQQFKILLHCFTKTKTGIDYNIPDACLATLTGFLYEEIEYFLHHVFISRLLVHGIGRAGHMHADIRHTQCCNSRNHFRIHLSAADINELIDAKVKKESNRFIQRWPDDKITIENARWGPIIKFGKKIVKFPRKPDESKYTAEDAATLSLDDVKKFIELEIPGAFTKKQRKAPAKKAAAKKASPKKAAKPATRKAAPKKKK